MAVETRFVVVRGGNEIMTFADKKAADEYDRMLDMADNIALLLETPSLALSDKSREDLSVYLAKNREELLIALLAKKRTAPVKSHNDETATQAVTEPAPAPASVEKAPTKTPIKAAVKPRKKKTEEAQD
ncbi:MAG: dsDNA-binding SOS-regulon protein [Alteromonadaceae bacterium]|jgi:dsDNA-binding SOS-regulon protein